MSSTSRYYVVYMPYAPTADAYPVYVQENALVDHLEEATRSHHTLSRKIASDDDLLLFKCNMETGAPNQCFQRAPAWLRKNAWAARMRSASLLSKYFPDRRTAPREDEKTDVLIVTDTMFAALHPSLPSEFTPLHGLHELNPYSYEVTFKMWAKGVEAPNLIPTWEGVIGLNDYKSKPELVEFIKDVVRKRRRAADGDKPSADQLLQSYRSMLDDGSQNPILDNLLSDDNSATPYACGNREMIHYNHALSYMKLGPVGLVASDKLKNEQAEFVVLDWFRDYWKREVKGGSGTSETQFPFPLIAELQNEAESTQDRRTYRPRPAVAFLQHDFPRLLVEVDSLSNRKDKRHLQVQMACVLRLAQALRKDAGINDEQFFLMGALFTQDWKVQRFFFYVSRGEICFNEETYDMKSSNQLTTFLFEFYNYVRHVKSDNVLGNKAKEIAKLVKDITNQNLPSLSGRPAKSNKCSRRSADHDDTDGRAGCSSTQPAQRTVLEEALRKTGYGVKVKNFDEFEPLVKLPAHIVEGRHPNGTQIIAKLVRKNSEELFLLAKQGSLKSPHNHVIPLCDTVQSSLGPLIVLPRAISLAHPIEFRDVLESRVVQLSHELIEGVAFLHRQKIAHLDIKPNNLVYDRGLNRLYIIDFDLAMQCKDVDVMVELSCGTPGWSAPEIVHDDHRPWRAFSPIRADLWSCGNVLRSFLAVGSEEDADLSMLMQMLMDLDPRRRPLLHEIVDEEPDFWTSGRFHRALTSHMNGQVQEPTMNGDAKLKRFRDDDDGEGLARKLHKQLDSTA